MAPMRIGTQGKAALLRCVVCGGAAKVVVCDQPECVGEYRRWTKRARWHEARRRRRAHMEKAERDTTRRAEAIARALEGAEEAIAARVRAARRVIATRADEGG